MAVKICNRFTGAVIRTVDAAALAGAYLAGADLAGANLAGANLAGANLALANLALANLAGANLALASLAGANLAGANLASANLASANLASANLAGANLASARLADAHLADAHGVSDRVIDGGLRADGYRFLLTRTESGAWRVKAGCRDFTLAEAHVHWNKTRPAGDPLGGETRLILAHMEALARLRGWPEA